MLLLLKLFKSVTRVYVRSFKALFRFFKVMYLSLHHEGILSHRLIGLAGQVEEQ